MTPIIVPGDDGQTFLDLQDLVLGDDFDSSKYRTQAKQAINDALDDLARQVALPALETEFSVTTTAGSTYPLPSDDVTVISAFDADSHNDLRSVPRKWIDDQDDVRGRPYAYAQYGGNVVLYPTPDRAWSFTFRYRRDAANLVDDDTPITDVIPDSYAAAVVAFARSELYGKEDDTALSDFWLGRYDRIVQRLRADVGRRRPKRQVPGMWRPSGRPWFSRP